MIQKPLPAIAMKPLIIRDLRSMACIQNDSFLMCRRLV